MGGVGFFPTVNNNNNDQLVSNSVYAFTIRDSVRLSPTLLSEDFHVFDYVDTNHQTQLSLKQELYLDGHLVDNKIPCHNYTVQCYHLKITQTFQIALEESKDAPYIFYMESDNDLCVSVKKIAQLAVQYQRYFISVGIGASGWIMSRKFLQDFINSAYFQNPTEGENGPDVYVAKWLRDTRQWSVTRQYFVQHTIIDSTTQKQSPKGLTVNSDTIEFDIKHLPRCFEPHRGMWIRSSQEQVKRDKFGWDYFDYQKCPSEEIFPCVKDGVSQIPIHRPLTFQKQPSKAFFRNSNDKIKRKTVNNTNTT